MTEPIPFTVTRFRCPTCPRTHASKARAREHMARCWFDPANRGCKTCEHFEPYSPAGDEPESCAVGVDLHRRVLGAGANEVVVETETTLPQLHCERWAVAS